MPSTRSLIAQLITMFVIDARRLSRFTRDEYITGELFHCVTLTNLVHLLSLGTWKRLDIMVAWLAYCVLLPSVLCRNLLLLFHIKEAVIRMCRMSSRNYESDDVL